MQTQKLVTTTAINPFDEVVENRICSLPTKAASDIYDKLGYRHYPFRLFCVIIECFLPLYNL